MSDTQPLPSDAQLTVDGGLSSADATPEPLVGQDQETTDPVGDIVSLDSSTTTDEHGGPAVVDLAVDRAIEADAGSTQDQATSAEAVDQGVVSTVDIERAELAAASHAEQLAALDAEVGSEALAFGVTAAGDREGDHVHAVTVAARAAKSAIDAGDGNVARARAFEAVDKLGRTDSPHGRVAEDHDAWAAARWAPHGDMNVPAVSYGPEPVAVLGQDNPLSRARDRGVGGDTKTDVADAKREAGDGVSIATERYRENQAAERNRDA